MKLISLQLKTTSDFNINLNTLIDKIKGISSDNYTIILAPELYLTGYSYDRLLEASQFTLKTIPILRKLSKNKTIAITMTTKDGDKFLNTLYIFHKGDIIHTQSKHQLFVLNDEKKYFTSGKLDDIKIINIDGVKIATLICFELRFVELWQRVQGADIILVPAMWGVKRKENYETLTQSLAVINQCFVVASDSANDDMAKSSGIITPFGDQYRDDNLEVLEKEINIKEIKKMRRYLPVGI